MSTSSKEKGTEAKQEGIANGKGKLPKATPAWSAFRNPRIVRVSRSFGGKDRHSKVCTVRGLRDRRIRLSAPAAIQLYDLQDRLGLSQPSKVIDWLLDTAKLDIDKLPPLQLPHGFGQMLDSNSSHQPSFLESNSIFNHCNLDDPQRNQDKLFPLASSAHSSFPAGLINNQIPFNSLCHWEASNHGTVFAQAENGSSLPSSIALSSGSQFILCPTGTVSSLFPQYVGTPLEAKEATHFEWLNSSSGLVHHHQRNTADQPDHHNALT